MWGEGRFRMKSWASGGFRPSIASFAGYINSERYGSTAIMTTLVSEIKVPDEYYSPMSTKQW